MAKLVKVELTYDDGTIAFLENEQAQLWDDACKAMSANSTIHGVPFPRLEWQERRIFTEVSPGLFVGTNESVFAKLDSLKDKK